MNRKRCYKYWVILSFCIGMALGLSLSSIRGYVEKQVAMRSKYAEFEIKPSSSVWCGPFILSNKSKKNILHVEVSEMTFNTKNPKGEL